jgi:hypothetical protein
MANLDPWYEYRRRRNLAWFAFLGYVPVCFTVALVSLRLFSTSPAFVLAIGWMISLSLQGTWPCGFHACDAGNGSLRDGAITTTLRDDVCTVACPNMPNRTQRWINECKLPGYVNNPEPTLNLFRHAEDSNRSTNLAVRVRPNLYLPENKRAGY